jgi:3-hydroxyisobutyrate/3-hydroxypropionate dehydrogenase
MLPKGQHVRHVFTDPTTGFLSATKENFRKIFIECSTIEVATSVDVRKLVEQSGSGMYVDAPVSGGPKGSDEGELTFMVGGSDEEFSRVKPILSMMGKSIFHCGGAGAGLATKCLNNYAAWVSFLGLCEGEFRDRFSNTRC